MISPALLLFTFFLPGSEVRGDCRCKEGASFGAVKEENFVDPRKYRRSLSPPLPFSILTRCRCCEHPSGKGSKSVTYGLLHTEIGFSFLAQRGCSSLSVPEGLALTGGDLGICYSSSRPRTFSTPDLRHSFFCHHGYLTAPIRPSLRLPKSKNPLTSSLIPLLRFPFKYTK